MSNDSPTLKVGAGYTPVVNLGNSQIPGGGSTTATVVIQDSHGNPVTPPPGSVLGIGSAPAQGSLDLVDHWDLAFFNQPGSQNQTRVYTQQNTTGRSQTSVIVAVLVYPDAQNRLVFSSSSTPVQLTIT